MPSVNLNEKRASRGEPLDIIIGEDTYTMAADLPMALFDELEGVNPESPEAMSTMVSALLGEEVYADLKTKHGFGVRDLMDVMAEWEKTIGISAGEYSASSS